MLATDHIYSSPPKPQYTRESLSSMEQKSKRDVNTTNKSLETKTREVNTTSKSLETKAREVNTTSKSLETKTREVDTTS